MEANCIVALEPNIFSQNWNLRDVIQILKANDADSYKLMCNNTHYLSTNVPLGCPAFDGGCFDERKPQVIYITNDVGNPAWAAAVLDHEICHLRQYSEKRDYNEEECYNKDSEFIQNIQLFTTL